MSYIRFGPVILPADPQVRVYTHQGVSWLAVESGAASIVFDGAAGAEVARALAAVLVKGADDLEAEIGAGQVMSACGACGGGGMVPAPGCSCPNGRHTCTPRVCPACGGSGRK